MSFSGGSRPLVDRSDGCETPEILTLSSSWVCSTWLSYPVMVVKQKRQNKKEGVEWGKKKKRNIPWKGGKKRPEIFSAIPSYMFQSPSGILDGFSSVFFFLLFIFAFVTIL